MPACECHHPPRPSPGGCLCSLLPPLALSQLPFLLEKLWRMLLVFLEHPRFAPRPSGPGFASWMFPAKKIWCWDQLAWVWSLLVLGKNAECARQRGWESTISCQQHPRIHQEGHFPAESQAPRRHQRSWGGGGDEFALPVPFQAWEFLRASDKERHRDMNWLVPHPAGKLAGEPGTEQGSLLLGPEDSRKMKIYLF